MSHGKAVGANSGVKAKGHAHSPFPFTQLWTLGTLGVFLGFVVVLFLNFSLWTRLAGSRQGAVVCQAGLCFLQARSELRGS